MNIILIIVITIYFTLNLGLFLFDSCITQIFDDNVKIKDFLKWFFLGIPRVIRNIKDNK